MIVSLQLPLIVPAYDRDDVVMSVSALEAATNRKLRFKRISTEGNDWYMIWHGREPSKEWVKSVCQDIADGVEPCEMLK